MPTGVAVTPATFTGPGGAAVPGVVLAWDPVEDPRIAELVVYAKPQGSDAANYVKVDTVPPAAGDGEVRGLTPGQALDFGFQFRNARGGVSDPMVEVLAITVPDALVATDTHGVGGRDAEALLTALDDISGLGGDLDAHLSEGLLRLAAGQRDLQAYLESLGYLEGLPVGVQVLDERAVREVADLAEIAARLGLAGEVDAAIAAETSLRIAADNVAAAARTVLAGRVGDAEGAIDDEIALRIPVIASRRRAAGLGAG